MIQVPEPAPSPSSPFRLGFFTQARGHPDQSTGDLYRQLLDTIVAAEELGFESVWIGQHHFGIDGGRVPSPLLLLTAAAERTRTIRLGTAVTALPLEDPIRLAEDAGVLFELAGGRLELGVGSGGGSVGSFTAFGRDSAERASLFEVHLTTLHRALDGKPLTDEAHGSRIHPYRPGLRRQLWQSAGSVGRAEAAARAGDGIIVGGFVDYPKAVQQPKIEAYRRELRRVHGHDHPPRIAATRFVYVGDSKTEVERLAAPALRAWQPVAARYDPTLADLTPAQYLGRVARYGTVDDVVASLEEDPALVGQVTDFIPTTGLFPAAGDATPGADLEIGRLQVMAEVIAPRLGWRNPRLQGPPDRSRHLDDRPPR